MFFIIPSYANGFSNSSATSGLTERQRNILLSLGAEENELENLTVDQIKSYLNQNSFSNFEYIEQYLPTEAEMFQDVQNYRLQKSLALRRLGGSISGEDFEYFLKSNNMNIYDINMMADTEVDALTNKNASINQGRIISPFSLDNNYTHFLVNGTTPNLAYAGTNFYIHRNCITTPYAQTATSNHYTEMKSKIAVSKAIGSDLFHKYLSSPSQYSYNHWGEVADATIGTSNLGTHQGIDFCYAKGTNVHSLCSGTVRAVNWFLGGYTIAIYNPQVNVTYVYMHTQNVNVSFGDSINYDSVIAQQGTYSAAGTTNSHTHFEVVDGDTYGVTTGGEIIRSLNSYTYGLYFAS